MEYTFNWLDLGIENGIVEYGCGGHFGITLTELMDKLPEYTDEQLLRVFNFDALAELLQELFDNQSGDELRKLDCIKQLEAEIDEAKDIDSQYNLNN
tara:strand:+ start:186 stop:476 length:291 start_codon:yes stop_codon:yes gene_type:complete